MGSETNGKTMSPEERRLASARTLLIKHGYGHLTFESGIKRLDERLSRKKKRPNRGRPIEGRGR